jgi:hypothetical protein
MALQVDITDYKHFVFFGCLLPLLILLIIGILVAFWYTFMAGPEKIEQSGTPVFVSTQFDKSDFRNREVC